MRKDLAAVDQSAAKKGAAEFGDRVANEELAKAEVQFQIGTMVEANKYKDDQDFDTIEERHAAGMQDQLGKAAANISSASTRALFLERGELGVAKANNVMNVKTTQKKNDRERGYMANAVDLMVKGGMDLEYGDPAEAALGIRLSLDSMVERNVISREDAEQTMRKAQLDMSYGRLKQMDPAQQLAILNSTDKKTKAWLENVPPDVLRQLRDQATSKGEGNMAQDWAMEHRGEDDAMDTMYKQSVKEDWDETLIAKTRIRILRVQQDDEVMKQKDLTDYYEEGAASIYTGETTLEMLEATPEGIEMLKKLSEAQRRNLVTAQDNAIERAAGFGRKYSEQSVVEKLQAYMASDNLIEGRKYWSENYAQLNMSDFKYFNVATSPTKSAALEFKPIRSARQLLTEHRKANPSMSDDEATAVWDTIDVQSAQYFNENKGKMPPKDMVNGWIEEELIQVRHKKNWWPDEVKFLYEMDAPQRAQVTEQLDFIQKATGFNRSTVGDLLSGYANDKYDFVPRMNEALARVRSKFPNEKPYQHWGRIKNMMGLEVGPEQLGSKVLDAGGESA